MRGAQVEPLVWYASYASNMSKERFYAYIQGGQARGAKIANVGCRDKTLPTQDRTLDLPYQMYFGYRSLVQDGGVAFIQKHPSVTTKGRAYLVSWQQYCDIVAQENQHEFVALPPIDIIKGKGEITLDIPHDGIKTKYTKVIYCGELEGRPVLSFTSPLPPKRYTAPSPNYLRLIGHGLQTAYNMDPTQLAHYFYALPGVKGRYTKTALCQIFTSE